MKFLQWLWHDYKVWNLDLVLLAAFLLISFLHVYRSFHRVIGIMETAAKVDSGVLRVVDGLANVVRDQSSRVSNVAELVIQHDDLIKAMQANPERTQELHALIESIKEQQAKLRTDTISEMEALRKYRDEKSSEIMDLWHRQSEANRSYLNVLLGVAAVFVAGRAVSHRWNRSPLESKQVHT